MFHRMKSEGVDVPAKEMEANADAEAVSEAKADDAPVEEEAQDADEKDSIAEPETVADTNDNTETTTMKKDVDDMTDTNTQQDSKDAPDAASAPSYQPPAQMSAPARTPIGGYPGSSPYAAGYASPSEGASSGDRRLTIGAGITMSGEIESCDYLLVEGTVEAALKGANVLDIAESGTFYGTVEIGEANIAGRFEGDISVHGRLTISASGTVTGSISYKELEIEAGAVIDGKLTPLSAVEKTAKKPAASKAKAAMPKAVKKSEGQAPANSDGELFSKAAAAAE